MVASAMDIDELSEAMSMALIGMAVLRHAGTVRRQTSPKGASASLAPFHLMGCRFPRIRLIGSYTFSDIAPLA